MGEEEKDSCENQERWLSPMNTQNSPVLFARACKNRLRRRSPPAAPGCQNGPHSTQGPFSAHLSSCGYVQPSPAPPPHAMATLHTILRRAALRHLANRCLQLGGRGLAIGCAISLVALILDRLDLVSVRTSFLLLPPGAGLLAGVLAAWFTRPRPLDLAVHLDRALALKDRLGTAHLIEKRSLRNLSDESGAFAEFVQRDAQRLTDNLPLARATPITITGVWITTAVLAMALWLGAAYLPMMPLFDRNGSTTVARADQTAQQEQARKAAEVMRQAVQDVPRDPTADPQLEQELAAIDRLAQQMSESGTPEAAERSRQEAAARLADVADRLAEQSRRDLAASEQLAERFAGMNAPGRPEAPLAAHDLDNALKRGDFDQAARELDELLNSAEDISAEDRRRLAESLRNAAQEFQKDSPPASDADADNREQLERTLADQGVDRQAIDEMLNNESPPQREDIERMLRERNVDEDIAGKLARELEELHDDQQARDQAQQDMKDVGESLDDAANQLEHPPAAPPAEDQPKEHPPQQNQRDQSTPPSDEQRQQTGDDSQPSDSQATTRPDSAQQPPQQSQSTTQPERAGEQQRDHTQSQEDSQAQESPQQNQSQSDEQVASTQPQSSPTPDNSPSTQPEARPAPSPQSQPSEKGEPQQQQQGQREQQPAEGGEQGQAQKQQQQSPQSQPDQTQQTPGAQSQPQSQPNPGDTTRQAQPQQTPEGQPQLQQDPQGREQTQVQRDQSDSQEEQQQQQTQGEDQQGTQQQAQPTPDQNQRQASPDGTPGESPPPKPSDTLRKLAERLADAKDQQQTSERLRQTARDLARNMTPGQREQWAQQWQREMGQNPPDVPSNLPQDLQPDAQASGAHGDTTIGDANAAREGNPNRDLANATTEDVDLRGKESGDQVLAQLLGEGGNDKGGTATSGAATQRIHQAQKAAERAVNDSAVPSRYHGFIKRVFGRLEQTTRDASGASEPSPPKPPTAPPPSTSGGGG